MPHKGVEIICVEENGEKNKVVFLRNADLTYLNTLARLESGETYTVDNTFLSTLAAHVIVFQARAAQAFVCYRGEPMIQDQRQLALEIRAFIVNLARTTNSYVASAFLLSILQWKFDLAPDELSLHHGVKEAALAKPQFLETFLRREISQSDFPNYTWWQRVLP